MRGARTSGSPSLRRICRTGRERHVRAAHQPGVASVPAADRLACDRHRCSPRSSPRRRTRRDDTGDRRSDRDRAERARHPGRPALFGARRAGLRTSRHGSALLALPTSTRARRVTTFTRREGAVLTLKRLVRRAAWSAAVRMGLQVYDPSPENLPRLEELTEYTEDSSHRRRAPDDGNGRFPTSPSCRTRSAASSTSSAFAAPVCSRWGRSTASMRAGSTRSCGRPSSCSPTSSRTRTCTRSGSDRSRARTASSTATCASARELLELKPFDLVFFLGVLYHSIHHLPLLGCSTVSPSRAGLCSSRLRSTRVRRPGSPSLAENGKAKGVPTIQAVEARARVDGVAQGHALHGLPARVDRGALPVREDGRAPRGRRPLRRRDSAPAR